MVELPETLRQSAVDALLRGEDAEEVAARVGVTVRTVRRWLEWHHEGRSLAERKRGGGNPPKLNEADMQFVEELVTARPFISREELRREVREARGKSIGIRALQKSLTRRGIRAQRPRLVERHDVVGPPAPTRYKPEHRRVREGGRFPTSLTDDEWAVIQPVFMETQLRSGRPPAHDRRLMLDAIFYVVRTGCSWRMLPPTFPKWEAVYACFSRWSKDGRFERMHDALRGMWRQREGRQAVATAGIVDSQTVRTTEKGGSAAMTGPSGSTGESGISS